MFFHKVLERCSQKSLNNCSKMDTMETNKSENWKCEKYSYLNRRRQSFVNIFWGIASCHYQIVSAFCFTIQHSSGVDCSIWKDFKVIIVACGYCVVDATIFTCWMRNLENVFKLFWQKWSSKITLKLEKPNQLRFDVEKVTRKSSNHAWLSKLRIRIVQIN